MVALYRGMFSTAAALAVNADQKKELEALVCNGNSSQKATLRRRLLLLAHPIAGRRSGDRVNLETDSPGNWMRGRVAESE